jgi:hypothetical protein
MLLLLLVTLVCWRELEETNQQVKSGRGSIQISSLLLLFRFLFSFLSKLFVLPAPLDGCICHTKKREEEGVGHCFVYYFFSISFILVLICIAAMMMIIISTFLLKKENT